MSAYVAIYAVAWANDLISRIDGAPPKESPEQP